MVLQQRVFDQFGQVVFTHVQRVNGLVQLVQAEQADQVEVHAMGLVDQPSQVFQQGLVAAAAALLGHAFERADLQVQRVLHVVDR